MAGMENPAASPRVLVVDDDSDVLASLERGLRLSGFDVTTAVDGAEALRSATETRPDAIVLDINMPVMNGFEFLDRYAEEFEVHAPVVAMLTSSHLGKDRERAMRYSFVKSYFEKPLLADHLRIMTELLAG